jgi:hypothetical protein
MLITPAVWDVLEQPDPEASNGAFFPNVRIPDMLRTEQDYRARLITLVVDVSFTYHFLVIIPCGGANAPKCMPTELRQSCTSWFAPGQVQLMPANNRYAWFYSFASLYVPSFQQWVMRLVKLIETESPYLANPVVNSNGPIMAHSGTAKVVKVPNSHRCVKCNRNWASVQSMAFHDNCARCKESYADKCVRCAVVFWILSCACPDRILRARDGVTPIQEWNPRRLLVSSTHLPRIMCRCVRKHESADVSGWSLTDLVRVLQQQQQQEN